MKFLLAAAAFFASVPFALAHGTCSEITINNHTYSAPPAADGKPFWTTQTPVRQLLALEPIGDLSSPDNVCGRSPAASAALVAPLTAGSSVSFKMRGGGGSDNSPWPHIKGAVLFYMARCPGSAKDCKPANLSWFKVDQLGLKPEGNNKWWQEELAAHRSVTGKIPKSIANGDYLLRIEILALHNAMNVGGAETTVFCTQVNVSGGTGGVPSGKYVTKFPSYSRTEKGILVDIWNNFTAYTFPGPAVYNGGASSSAAPRPTSTGSETDGPSVPANVGHGPSKTSTVPSPSNTKVCRRRRSRRAVVIDGAAFERRSFHHRTARRYAALH